MVWCRQTIWGKRPDRKRADGGRRSWFAGAGAKRRGRAVPRGDEKHNVHASRDWGCTKQGGRKVINMDFVWTSPTRDRHEMRVRREDPNDKRPKDRTMGWRMKWLEMFDWKGNLK